MKFNSTRKIDRDHRTPSTYFTSDGKSKHFYDSSVIVEDILNKDYRSFKKHMYESICKRLQDKDKFQKGMINGGRLIENTLFSQ